MARPAPSAREQRELDEKIRPRSMASHVSNARAITFVRTGMAVIAGGAAGILGFTGLSGFAVYILLHVIASGALLLWMRMDPGNCVGTGPLEFLADGLMGQMLTFILCWTFAFALVHVY